MSKKIAWVVSRVFDPVIEIPFLLSVAVWFSMVNGLRWRFLVILILVDAVLPALYMLWGLKTKKISDWDMTKREERGGVYFFTVLCHLFGVVLAGFLGKMVLFKILLILWVLAVVFAAITFVWKISVHAGVNGAFLAFFNHFWGWDRYWWLVLVLLIVLWSRVVIKKHTFMQVLLGATLSISIVSVGLKLLVPSLMP